MQAMARCLFQAGQGLLQFYIPLIFVNQVGLSATAVGIGLGSASISGIFGHFLGGTLADAPTFGRKKTLLLSAGLAIVATLILSVTQSLPLLVVSNLLLGVSMGFYWTAADAAVMDATSTDDRHQAFSVLGVAENLGLGLGILGGSILLSHLANPRHLFVVNSLIFLSFLIIIQAAIQTTSHSNAVPTATTENPKIVRGWLTAIRDKWLWVFLLVNSLFTTYIALVNSTLPLYFNNFVNLAHTGDTGVSAAEVANLFTWGYIGLGALLQIPIVQALGSLGWARALMVSAFLWGTGFLLVGILGALATVPFVNALGVLAVFAIATIIYKPFAVSFIAELAPEPLRGTYTAIGYQCWVIGYFIGPTAGGWALDQSVEVADASWKIVAMSTVVGLMVLWWLTQRKLGENKVLRSQDSIS
jgi:MFS family permease